MLTIYLARHGQDEDNANGILNGRRDMPLTEIGKAQAVALAENIKQLQLDFVAVYASPLQRAFKTAEIISDIAHTPKPIAIDDLIERNFGAMSGEPVAGIAERCAPNILKAEIITYFLTAEGAETFPDLIARAKHLLEHLKSLHTVGNILLVTHGDFGKMLYAAFYNLSWKDVLLQFHFGNSELLLLSEDSLAEDAYVFKQDQFNH